MVGRAARQLRGRTWTDVARRSRRRLALPIPVLERCARVLAQSTGTLGRDSRRARRGTEECLDRSSSPGAWPRPRFARRPSRPATSIDPGQISLPLVRTPFPVDPFVGSIHLSVGKHPSRNVSAQVSASMGRRQPPSEIVVLATPQRAALPSAQSSSFGASRFLGILPRGRRAACAPNDLTRPGSPG